MKPLIGITPDFNPGDRPDMGGREPTLFLRARYIQAIEALGGIPLVLPLTSEATARQRLLRNLDGLLLTGSGPDLPPRLYGERQRYPFPVMSPRRFEFELDLVHLAVARRLPLLGICGGMQAINVALGGSLIQDLKAQWASPLQHRARGRATRLAHGVAITSGSLLRRILRLAHIRVNSSHHQAIRQVAPTLRASAFASDGVIEAVEAPRHPFLLGVQWHPEFLYDRHAVHRRLFQAFLQAASR